jgi:O-antigen/teichoic acid export membrane protein
MRFLGLISTLILARLLMPADFGLVALAMAIYGFSELFGAFGFDAALIHKQDAADRSHYDTAWTLNFLYALLRGLVLLALAGPLAALMDTPKLEGIVQILAGLAILPGLNNIGVVEFRKEMHFHKEFAYEFTSRVMRFVVTVALAFVLRNYWALVAGIVTGVTSKTALSYLLHPYRPRPQLSQARDLFAFSKWYLAGQLFGFVNQRADMLIIGGLAGVAPLGLYRVAHEFAHLPSTELVQPIVRAVFPAYAKVAESGELAYYVERMLGGFATLAVPASLGLALVADNLVPVVLGEKWLEAIPLLGILAIYGLLAAFFRANHPIFLALGKPWINTYYAGARALMAVPVLWLAVSAAGPRGAALAQLSIAAVLLPPYLYVVRAHLGMAWGRFAAAVWRPLGASLGMAGVVTAIGGGLVAPKAAVLAAQVSGGAAVFVLGLALLWLISGRPEGAESELLRRFGGQVGRRLAPRRAVGSGHD